MQNNDKLFPTKQTPLAAWLHSQGFKILEVRTLEFPATIVFENSASLKKCIRLWETGQAEGNCNTFYDSHRLILNAIKPSWLWRGR